MKVIISENTLKPILYRLFDYTKSKYGYPVLDFETIKLFGLSDGYIDRGNYRDLFIEYLGGMNTAIELGKKLLNDMKGVQSVDLKPGSIDFLIDSVDYGDGFYVDVLIVGGKLEDENGDLKDFFDFAEELGLGDSADFDDYIKNEITEYLFTIIFKRTGLYVNIDEIEAKYSKLIDCKNCGWSWREFASDPNEKYKCHKCGYDNEKGV